ncbi:MAG: mechanosensitive ion channel [Chloroflexi bacterium]|nr:mechanosensitive ion channel [Chloroflexota bacterium]
MPNAKFAETIITNYNEPLPAVNVWLTCGVSYDSDLELVERVCREVMTEALDTSPDAIKEYGSWFAFDKFDDSNVGFWLFVQAKDRWGSKVLQSDLIKGLHRRFREEGIVINYPMRTLKFPEGWGPDELSGVNGIRSAGRRGRRRGSMRGRAGRLRALGHSRAGRATGRDGGGGGTGSAKMEETKDPAAE